MLSMMFRSVYFLMFLEILGAFEGFAASEARVWFEGCMNWKED